MTSDTKSGLILMFFIYSATISAAYSGFYRGLKQPLKGDLALMVSLFATSMAVALGFLT